MDGAAYLARFQLEAQGVRVGDGPRTTRPEFASTGRYTAGVPGTRDSGQGSGRNPVEATA